MPIAEGRDRQPDQQYRGEHTRDLADLFHGPAFGTILGLANGGGGLGGLIGPFVGGYLFDVTGDYRASFALSAFAIAGATAAAWIAAPRNAATFRDAPQPRRRPGH